MRNFVGAVTLALAPVVAAGMLATPSDSPPSWAYVVSDPGFQPAKDDGTVKHVPGSNRAFTVTQIRELFNVPDWHPVEHPQMPEVVAHGRQPGVPPCGYCHLPTGLGRPENSSLAGLPASYIAQQMADFKSGARKCSEPRMAPPARMIALAQYVTDAEVKAAADYFSLLKPKPWIRVVESDIVPKTDVGEAMLVPSEAGGTEPIGQRIIEVPEDPVRVELRDSDSGFVAYVPAGSIKKGEALVTTGGANAVGGQIVGKTVQCGICHGRDLKGLATVPGLAGRSPSYMFRQLYDMQHGVRTGPGADLMKAVVANLSEDDMMSITAYTASRVP